jgi:Holliday junction resolvase
MPAEDFNSPAVEAYNFQNFILNLFGFEVVHFSGFDGDAQREIEVINGKRGEPVAYAVKNFKRNVKALIHAEELEKLVKLAAPWGGNPEYLPPSPCVGIAAPYNRTPMKIIYPQVLLTKWSYAFKEGTAKTEIPLEFVVLQRPVITFE